MHLSFQHLSTKHTHYFPHPPKSPCRITATKTPQKPNQQQHRRSIILSTPLTLLCCGGGNGNGPLGNNNKPPTTQHRNAALDKMFAQSMFEGMVDYEMAISPIKRKLFRQLKDANCNTVVELGAGTGPNLPYYGKDTNVIAVDVNQYMRSYFQKNMDVFNWTPDRVTWVEASAESVPLDSASVDAVVCTLLLCSVPDVKAVIVEAKRLLKPGGKLLFIEHTIAPGSQPLLRVGQTLFNPFQQWFADGCHLTRNPLPIIREAGFSEVEAEEFNVEGMNLIAPHVAGIATL